MFRLCENLPQAITYIKQARAPGQRHLFRSVGMLPQGEVRIGPDLATNPALHMTREMEDPREQLKMCCQFMICKLCFEDHITWAEGSKMRRHIKEFSNEAHLLVLVLISPSGKP